VDRRVDVAIALTISALGVVILVASQQIGKSPVPDPVGPRGIPILLGGFFVIAGVLLAGRRLIRWNQEGTIVPPEGSEDDKGVEPGSAWRAISIWLASLVYVITLPYAGFLVGTPLFIGFALWRLRFDRSPVLRIPALIVYPVVFTVANYLFFATFLGVRLPVGFVREIATRVSGN
jgi:hypothetical protein